MPMVGLGTYGVSDAKTVVDALDIGYRHLDCAAIYGNEHVVGQAIRPFIDQGRSAELFLTSKLWNDCHAPGAVRAACEKTLKDLGESVELRKLRAANCNFFNEAALCCALLGRP